MTIGRTTNNARFRIIWAASISADWPVRLKIQNGVTRKQLALVTTVTTMLTASLPPARRVQTAADASVHGMADVTSMPSAMSRLNQRSPRQPDDQPGHQRQRDGIHGHAQQRWSRLSERPPHGARLERQRHEKQDDRHHAVANQDAVGQFDQGAMRGEPEPEKPAAIMRPRPSGTSVGQETLSCPSDRFQGTGQSLSGSQVIVTTVHWELGVGIARACVNAHALTTSAPVARTTPTPHDRSIPQTAVRFIMSAVNVRAASSERLVERPGPVYGRPL